MVNLAIDGETASSFVINAGRTPPVMGRGDAPLQLRNLNYGDSAAISQGAGMDGSSVSPLDGFLVPFDTRLRLPHRNFCARAHRP